MAIQAEFLRRFVRTNCDWKPVSYDFIQPNEHASYDFVRPANILVVNSESDEYGNIETYENNSDISTFILEDHIWKPVYTSRFRLLEPGNTLWLGHNNRAVKLTYEKLSVEEQNQLIFSDVTLI